MKRKSLTAGEGLAPKTTDGGSPKLFVNKRGLKNALGIPSTRLIDEWVRKRMISFIRAGHRTLLFSVEQVRKDLARFEVKAIGRNRE